MRIVFCWQWENSLDVIVRFDEGLGGVLRRLAQEGHDVTITSWGEGAEGRDQGVTFLIVPPTAGFEQWAQRVAALQPDVLLGWGTVDHRIIPEVRKLLPQVPAFFFLAGGGVDHPGVHVYDHYFVETNFHIGDLGKYGKPSSRALGVLTDVLTPIEQAKQWDVFLPASFTANKRYSLFCDIVELGGFRGVAVGPLNDEGCWVECKKVYVPTFGYVSRRVLRDFYCASRCTVLTGGVWGGSQRTLLESLSCGIPVVATDDNPQLDWLLSVGAPVVTAPPIPELLVQTVRHVLEVPPSPQALRDFVLQGFTVEHYYQVVKERLDVLDPAHA
jgi:hypothetical protein